MKALYVEILNSKGFKILEELEALNLIKMMKSEPPQKKEKLSEKYKGILTKKEGKELNDHIQKSRNEW
jgi:hypothetical protein